MILAMSLKAYLDVRNFKIYVCLIRRMFINIIIVAEFFMEQLNEAVVLKSLNYIKGNYIMQLLQNDVCNIPNFVINLCKYLSTIYQNFP